MTILVSNLPWSRLQEVRSTVSTLDPPGMGSPSHRSQDTLSTPPPTPAKSLTSGERQSAHWVLVTSHHFHQSSREERQRRYGPSLRPGRDLYRQPLNNHSICHAVNTPPRLQIIRSSGLESGLLDLGGRAQRMSSLRNTVSTLHGT